MVEGPSRVSSSLSESGRSRWVASRARSRSPRHHAPDVSWVASGPATSLNRVSSTPSQSLARARQNDDRFRFTRANWPRPGCQVSRRSARAAPPRTTLGRTETGPGPKYTTSRAGTRRRRRSARPCSAVAASISSAMDTFAGIPIRIRCPAAPHPVTPGATAATAQKQLHWPRGPQLAQGAARRGPDGCDEDERRRELHSPRVTGTVN